MFCLGILLIHYVLVLKVFKKTSPNGKLTVYLGKRDFVDHVTHVDPIDGVLIVDTAYLEKRKVLGQVATTFRYGREEDEVMGLRFSKELRLIEEQLVPSLQEFKLTTLQDRLLQKFGSNAFPFLFELPSTAPCSVTIQPGGDHQGRPLGVQYELRIYVGDTFLDRPHRRNSVGMAVRKVQYSPFLPDLPHHEPCASVSKGFALSPGRVDLLVSLDKDLYYHGEVLCVKVQIRNNSRKTVRSIHASVVQAVDLTMICTQYSRFVAGFDSKEGCPITPDAQLSTVFYLTPVVGNVRDKRGIAVDGRLKDEDVHLASSTLLPDTEDPADAVGILVSYAVRIRLNMGVLGGDVTADLPFKLMHPCPQASETNEEKQIEAPPTFSAAQRRQDLKKKVQRSIDVVFEDFAKWRQSLDEDPR